jgi:hypothetical protein
MPKEKVDRTLYKIEHINSDGEVVARAWGKGLDTLASAMVHGWDHSDAVQYRVVQCQIARLGMDELVQCLNGTAPIQELAELMSVARPPAVEAPAPTLSESISTPALPEA